MKEIQSHKKENKDNDSNDDNSSDDKSGKELDNNEDTGGEEDPPLGRGHRVRNKTPVMIPNIKGKSHHRGTTINGETYWEEVVNTQILDICLVKAHKRDFSL